MIERYLSILEVSQKQAYIFGSNKLRDNVLRSAEIWWLTDPERIDDLIRDKSCFDHLKNTVYAGGGHTVLVFESYGKAVDFNRRYSFQLRAMNPDIEVFLFMLPYCSRVSAKRMLDYVCSRENRTQDEDEVFAAQRLGSGQDSAEECTPSRYLSALVSGLERKKALRLASFRQGSFGVEKIEADTRSVKSTGRKATAAAGKKGSVSIPFLYRSNFDGSFCPPAEQEVKAADYEALRTSNGKVAGSNPVPEGYAEALSFENLGGSKGDVNLLAVVHVDGNGMGARCNQFYEGLSRTYLTGRGEGKDEALLWEEFRKAVNGFSTAIDRHFKEALSKMYARVRDSIKKGSLQDLSLKTEKHSKEQYFPIRGIIASGDDICFVTDGRIGIECAAVFLEELGKLTNDQDGKSYSASAGVTIIHAKYPFFRAYELAEGLCSKAKEFAAGLRAKQTEEYRRTHGSGNPLPPELLDNGAGICAIDWHLELGEIGMSIDEIRGTYLTKGTSGGRRCHLEMRPYVVAVHRDVQDPLNVGTIEPHRQYAAFKKQMEMYKKTDAAGAEAEDVYARLKELRGILKEGEAKAQHYIRFHKLKGMIVDNYYGIFKEIGIRENPDEIPLFVETADKEARSVIFDAAEAIEIFSLL